MRSVPILALATCLLLPAPVPAQPPGGVPASSPARPAAPPAATAEGMRVLDSAVVRGVVPGPGMWKVHKGGNTMWILGVQSPLPARMQWNSGKVRAVIRDADEVLGSPGLSVHSDVGFFGQLALLPSLLKVRASPDGRTLQDVVPAPLYARWLALKQRYIGRDGGVEKWRPVFAAMRLYERAIERSGLTSSKVVEPIIAKALKERGLKSTPTYVRVNVDNPKQALREFRRAEISDLDCFEKTLSRLETDLGTMRERANAWAVGDVSTLQATAAMSQFEACTRALTANSLGRRHGIHALDVQMKQRWLAAAETALGRSRKTFALLPMALATGPGNYIAALEAKGYVVEPPR